jgi:hypothetical protein
MRKLEFQVSQKEDFFTVHLGNGEWLKFNNRTKAETFVRKYKNVIQDNVGMLNLMQPQLNALYRQNIMSLDDTTQRRISQELMTFEKRFDFIFGTFSPGNQNSFIFQNIDTCLGALCETSRLLYDYAKRYKHYGLKISILPIIKNLEIIERQLNLDKKNLFVNNGYRRNVKILSLSEKPSNLEKTSS